GDDAGDAEAVLERASGRGVAADVLPEHGDAACEVGGGGPGEAPLVRALVLVDRLPRGRVAADGLDEAGAVGLETHAARGGRAVLPLELGQPLLRLLRVGGGLLGGGLLGGLLLLQRLEVVADLAVLPVQL